MALPIDFEEQSANFLSWFTSQPGTSFHPSLRIADLRDRHAGRGIIAASDIPPDTELFAIPRSIIISVENSRLAQKLPEALLNNSESVFPDENNVDEEESDGDPHNIPRAWIDLILVLIYEFLHRETSRWHLYFEILPKKPTEFNSLMFWDSSELQNLQSSHVLARIGKDDANYIFRKSVLPIVTQNVDIFYPDTTSSPLSDEELLQMAHCMGSLIMSYAFDLQPDDDADSSSEDDISTIDGWKEDKIQEGMMGMVPMADMLNADAEFNAHLSHGDDALTMTSLRDIRAGEEVLNYYGPLPNAELCRRYGYTSRKHAIYDVVELPWTLVKTCVFEQFAQESESTRSRLSKTVDALEQENDLAHEAFLLERENEGPDDTGICTTPGTFKNAPEDLVNLIVTDIFSHVLRQSTSEKEKKRCFLLIFLRILNARLSQYDTTLKQDEDLSINASGRLQMAIDVRLGEKRLMLEAIDWTEHKLAGLLETYTNRNQTARSPPRKKQRKEK